jgi:hypothetical protein
MCPSTGLFARTHAEQSKQVRLIRGSGWKSVLEIVHVQNPLDLNLCSSRWNNGRNLFCFEPRIV